VLEVGVSDCLAGILAASVDGEVEVACCGVDLVIGIKSIVARTWRLVSDIRGIRRVVPYTVLLDEQRSSGMAVRRSPDR
jgi:hypothetical protein